MSMSVGAKLQLEPGSWAELVYDVCIGIAVGAAHSFYIVTRWWNIHMIHPILQAFGLKLDQEETNNGKEKTLKVVAVGYGRTGTYSLTLALEELGFPTLHTQHLYEHQDIINMWTNDIFLPSIEAKKTLMGKPDLQLIANKFQATADLPMALYFEQVMEEYPDCKFVLTERENSEIWFRSWDTLTKSITEPTNLGGFVFSNVRQYSYYLRWLFSNVNKDESYLTTPFPLPHQKKQAAIESYEEHNRKVREKIPAERLLKYNVKEGWAPLCDFLEIANCPQSPFPKTNSARSVQVQAISAFIAPLICFLFVLFYVFASVFQRATGMTVLQWSNWKSKELMITLRRVMLGETVDWGHPYPQVRKKS